MRGPREQERSRERPRLAFRPKLLRLPNERAGTYADILPFHSLARREAGRVLLAGPARTPAPASEPTPHPSHRVTVTCATAHAGRSFTHSTCISKFLLHVGTNQTEENGVLGPPVSVHALVMMPPTVLQGVTTGRSRAKSTWNLPHHFSQQRGDPQLSQNKSLA